MLMSMPVMPVMPMVAIMCMVMLTTRKHPETLPKMLVPPFPCRIVPTPQPRQGLVKDRLIPQAEEGAQLKFVPSFLVGLINRVAKVMGM